MPAKNTQWLQQLSGGTGTVHKSHYFSCCSRVSTIWHVEMCVDILKNILIGSCFHQCHTLSPCSQRRKFLVVSESIWLISAANRHQSHYAWIAITWNTAPLCNSERGAYNVIKTKYITTQIIIFNVLSLKEVIHWLSNIVEISHN